MILRCSTCGLVDRSQSMAVALTIEQVRHYLRELVLLGVPEGALLPVREWAQTLRRCTCDLPIDL